MARSRPSSVQRLRTWGLVARVWVGSRGQRLHGRLTEAPLALPAVAVALGIALDRSGTGSGAGLSATAWAGLALALGLLAWRTDRCGCHGRARGLIGLSLLALGAGWHHHQDAERPGDDLSWFAWDPAQPVLVRGVLAEVPETRLADGPEATPSTRLVLDVSAVDDPKNRTTAGLTGEARGWRPASGRLLVFVGGVTDRLAMGDAVQAAGRLETVRGPLNPGEPDRRDRLRAQGIRLRLSVDAPEGVWPDPERAGPWPRRWLGRLRTAAYERLVAGLDPEAVPLAAALLLGRRDGVDPEVNDAFARTGTAHLLAISGLHMQALAAVVGLGLTALGLGRRPTALVVILTTAGYAVLVGAAASVVRSAVMTIVGGLAVLGDRPTHAGNILAAAALVTLALQPQALIDAGAQLSFLAVMALLWGVPPAARRLGLAAPAAHASGPDDDPQAPPVLTAAQRLDAVEQRYAPRWRRWLGRLGQGLALALVASAVVWLITLPLVLTRFHLIPLIGLLLNVGLVPLSVPTLATGGLALGLAWLWPPLALPAGWACARLLDLTERLVRWGATVPGGHRFAAGPGEAWTLVVYGLLALVALAGTLGPWSRRLGRGLLAGWVALGVVLAVWPPPPAVPTAEVLAVDHGLCVLIRSPGGGTGGWLYDCGRMRDPHVGRRLIAPALWARGVRHLDGVILSHADFDHYGALPDLLERFAVGAVFVPPGFAAGSPADAAVQALLQACQRRGVPVRSLAAGDRLDLGSGLTATVRHPPADWSGRATSDNARSLVLDLAHGGQHLWLTGDLDGDGLAALTAGSPRPAIDAWLAPHHGGRTANPVGLYDWARPRLVLVSQRRPADPANPDDPLSWLEGRGLPVHRTWRQGALLVRWTPGGLRVEPFLAAAPGVPPGGGGDTMTSDRLPP